MARKIATIKIDAPGRDLGKVFVLTEMDAWSAEAWATKVFFAVMNAGADIPEAIADAGFAGLAMMSSGAMAAMAFKALGKVPVERAKPILDEMMQCVKIQPSAGITREIFPGDIEEVSTLIRLKKEVWKLHFDFFTDGGESISDFSKAAQEIPA